MLFNDTPQPSIREEIATRKDVLAGLTAAAVVAPKAMAYATIAGLPVQVGLYTAIVPMAVYAALGTSRPLSVSTTTTIAILTAAALGQAAPGGSRRRADCGLGDAGDPRRRAARAGVRGPARVRRELHLRTGAHRVQIGHRRRHRRRPDAEASRHSHHEGRFLQGSAGHRPARARYLHGDAARGAGRARPDLRARAFRAALPCAARRHRAGDCRIGGAEPERVGRGGRWSGLRAACPRWFARASTSCRSCGPRQPASPS